MAYSQELNDRIREALSHFEDVEEKHMFGGSCFMLHGKMCVGVAEDKMMCRIGPAVYEEALKRNGCTEMDFTGRAMKGYVFVTAAGYKTKKDFDYWMKLCVDFNKIAKASGKKK